ncbi:MAG: hypothetical protein ACI8QY_000477, partial [bacterium]
KKMIYTALVIITLTACYSTILQTNESITIRSTVQKTIDNETCKPTTDVSPVLIDVTGANGSGSYGSGIRLDTDYGDNIFLTNAHVVTMQNTSKHTYWKERLYKRITIIDKNRVKVEAEVIGYTNSGDVDIDEQIADIAILRSIKPLPQNFVASKHKLAQQSKKEAVFLKGYTSKPNIFGLHPIEKCLSAHPSNKALYLSKGYEKSYAGQSGAALLNKNAEIVGLLTKSGEATFADNNNPQRIYIYRHKGEIVPSLESHALNLEGLPLYASATPLQEIIQLVNKTFQ